MVHSQGRDCNLQARTKFSSENKKFESSSEDVFFFLCCRRPQSEIRVKVLACQFQEIGEKCGKILAKKNRFTDFRPSISRENGRKKIFTSIPPRIRTSNSTGPEPKFFHCNTLGVGGKFF